MRIAVIADIHGNLPAFESVLADIERHGVDRTINLGDCVSGPLWPREVCDLLMACDDLNIRGNHDRWVSGPDRARMGASDRYACSQLNQDHRSWLVVLPTSASADHGILACHGTPIDDNRYLIEEASEGRLVRAGSPPARYAILDINEDRVSADMIAITYDWKSAVARAESNGRPDWANGLRTGWFIAGTRSS
jgi:hypothetical protein